MALLGYNWRLAWVVVPVIIWAMLGLTLAIGAERRGQAPVMVRLGLPPGSYVIRGRALRIEERAGRLTLQVAVPRNAPQETHDAGGAACQLPDDISVEFATPPQPPLGPPQVLLESGRDRPHLGRGERSAVLTAKYIIHSGPDEVWIIPRDKIAPERLRELLRRDRERRRMDQPPSPPVPPDAPPPDQQWRDRRRDRQRVPEGAPGNE